MPTNHAFDIFYWSLYIVMEFKWQWYILWNGSMPIFSFREVDSVSVLRLTKWGLHYADITMSLMASQITSLTIVYSTVYSGANQRKHQSSASLAFVWGIHRGPVNSPHKWPVTRKMFPFDDVIMVTCLQIHHWFNAELMAWWLFGDKLLPKSNADILSFGPWKNILR